MNEQLDLEYPSEAAAEGLPRLPSSWSWTTLGNWLEGIEAGKSFRCEERPPTADEVGVVKVSSVTWGTFQEHESKTCKHPELIRPDIFVRPGDFLISRANTIELVGACVLVGELRHRKLMLSDKILRLRFSEGDPRWFLWALRTAVGRAEIQRLATGNQESMRNIGQDRIRQIRLPVAPPQEQARILAALETQFSRLDAAVEGLKRVQANLKRYRASLLKAAVEGRLVSTEAALAKQEGRDYEPASVLLERILKERRHRWEQAELAKLKASGKIRKDDKWRTRYEEPAAPDTSELPELPEGWCWTSIGEAFLVRVGATPSRSVQAYWGGGIPWVSSGEVAFCRIKSTRETITEEGLAGSSTRINPIGSVLIGMIGEGKTRGQVAILDTAACNNQNAAAIWVSEAGCSPEYVFRYLESQYEQSRRRGSGNNQPALNKSRVQGIPLPLPPLSEQHRIAAAVDEKLSVVEHLEDTVRSDLERCARLRQSILKWAFEGKLVDQDPNDEPASVLLDRIRTERAVESLADRPGPTARAAGNGHAGSKRATMPSRRPHREEAKP